MVRVGGAMGGRGSRRTAIVCSDGGGSHVARGIGLVMVTLG